MRCAWLVVLPYDVAHTPTYAEDEDEEEADEEEEDEPWEDALRLASSASLTALLRISALSKLTRHFSTRAEKNETIAAPSTTLGAEWTLRPGCKLPVFEAPLPVFEAQCPDPPATYSTFDVDQGVHQRAGSA